MAKKTNQLKALGLARKPPGMHPDGRGLFLQVTPKGARSWTLRYTLRGRAREMGLGAFPDVTLEVARKLASEARLLRASDVDPIDARKDERAAAALEAAKAVSFRQAAERYMEAQRGGWSLSHAHDWRASLTTHAFPLLGHWPVQAVDTDLVLRVLEPIWQTRYETASRLRGRIEVILDAAKALGQRSGENPARWRGHLKLLLDQRRRRTVEHFPALPYADMPAFIAELRAVPGPAARALELLVLTAARSGEVRGARRCEIDLAARAWTVPAGRMKARREHRVPLCERAVEILAEQLAEHGGEHVFPGELAGEPIGREAMKRALLRLRPGTTVHGMRAAFKTWASASMSFPREIVEAALAHVNGDKVEAAYQRDDLLDPRRRLMEAWARYVDTPPDARGEVVQLRA